MKKQIRTPVTRDPQRTRQRILDAAYGIFADKGFAGARVDAIALAAGVNKRMIYHYFRGKEGLFGAVLDRVYAGIGVHLNDIVATASFAGLAPDAAMGIFVDAVCDYFAERQDVIAIVNSENIYGGRHMTDSANARGLSRTMENLVAGILENGVTAGRFRAGVPPRDLVVTVIAMGYYFHANRNPLTIALGRDFGDAECTDSWRRHARESILRFIAAEPQA